MPPDVAEYWLDELKPESDGEYCCPRCFASSFTASAAPYGIKLACWACPTFIGIRKIGA